MKSKYFKIQELIHPSYYNKFGERSWIFMQQPILIVADAIRETLGRPIVVNNWASGGNLSLCGLRPFDSEVGAQYSIHKFGGALDLHFSYIPPKEVYEMILDNQSFWYKLGLRRVENIVHTPTWLHIDCSNTHVENEIVVFNV
jgi:hypothetical protein